MKKKLINFSGLLLLFLFICVGCNKAINEKAGDDTSTVTKKDVKGIGYKKGGFVFSMSNLRKITRPRSLTAAPVIQTSHLYMVFQPVTAGHYRAIEEKNIPTYPFPLATDSLDVSNPDYSNLYTFLPIKNSGNLPNCPYIVLDSVCLLNPESPTAALAYQAAGKEIIYRPNGDDIPQEPADPCDPWEDCPIEEPPPPPPPPPPAPPKPADNRSTPFSVEYDNCSMNTDENYPSGRITVEETQWGNGGIAYEGVRDVKVEILGPQGQRVIAQTDRYGCFKATGAIRGFRPLIGPRLPVILNVIFKSDRKEIRGMNKTIPDQYTKPLLHIYGNISYSMNNANVSYERHTSNEGDDTKYYVAATVNNALYEFDEYAANDGILSPGNDLKILVTCFAGSASTPMLNDLKSRNVWDAAAVTNYLNTRVGGLGGILAPSAPDIVFGYAYVGTSSADFATDKIKETAYHEFAHASHYRKTTTQMWIDNVKYVADYGVGSGNPYGHVGDPGVERTDLIEMWGYFMGREYAHRRYGPNAHSAILEYYSVADASPSTFNNSWYAVNEHRSWIGVNIFEHDHIPAGFLHDIIDSNVYNQRRVPGLFESTVVADTIAGYSISRIYNNLDGSTGSPAILMNKLRNYLPLGNATAHFDLLRNSYGY